MVMLYHFIFTFIFYLVLLKMITDSTIIIENKIVIPIMHNINYKTLKYSTLQTFHLWWEWGGSSH